MSNIVNIVNIKTLSGEIIKIEDVGYDEIYYYGDEYRIEKLRKKIRDKFYPGYPVNFIKLIDNDEDINDIDNDIDNEIDNDIDFYLYVFDRTELECFFVKDKIYDRFGKLYSKYDILYKNTNKIVTVYLCQNYKSFKNCFILSKDIKVIFSNENYEIINTSSIEFKTISDILRSFMSKEELDMIKSECLKCLYDNFNE